MTDIDPYAPQLGSPTGVRNALLLLPECDNDEDRLILLRRCAAALTEQAEEIIVERAVANWDRKSGWSWDHIGRLLNVSRQAASKRYRPRVDAWRAAHSRRNAP